MRPQRWFQENAPGPGMIRNREDGSTRNPDVAAAAWAVADSQCMAPQLHKLIIWVYSCNAIAAGLFGVAPWILYRSALRSKK